MNASYSDIIQRIESKPIWYDENGCPRYDSFAPGDVADIYADEVALLEIACQSCDRRFHVALSRGRWNCLDYMAGFFAGWREGLPAPVRERLSSLEQEVGGQRAEEMLGYVRPELPAHVWQTLQQEIKAGTIHYGDPPAHCASGDSMNCIDLRVLEYWKRHDFDWRREPEMELDLLCESAEE